MKKIKFFTFVGLASCVMLAGCGQKALEPDQEEPSTPSHAHTFDEDHWETDENSHWHKATCEHTNEKSAVAAHTFGEDGKCSVCEFYNEEYDASLKDFTKEKLGYLAGKFYSFNMVLDVGVEGATISYGNEKVELNNRTIKGNGFETEVSYKDSNGAIYYLSWEKSYYSLSYDQNQKIMVDLGLMVPTFKVGKQSFQFQPDMTNLSGWYDGWYEPLWNSNDYEFEKSILCYVLGNEFDYEANMFKSNVASLSYEECFEGQYVYSAFVEVEGAVYQTVSFFDSDDFKNGYNFSDFAFFADKDVESGRIDLCYITDPEYSGFESRASMLMGSYLKPEDVGMSLTDFDYYEGLFFSELDEELGTVYVEYDLDPVAVSDGFDDLGSYVIVGDMKIRGNKYGITVEKEGIVEEYPFLFSSSLFNIEYKEFSSGKDTIEFNYDWDTWDLCLYINGVIATDCTVEIYDHKLAFSGTVDTDTYYMLLHDEDVAVEVVKNGKSSLYLNASKLSSLFTGDFYTSDMVSFIISEDEGITVTIGEGDPQSALFVYSEEYNGPVLTFGEGNTIVRLSSSKKLFAWLTPEEDGGSILYEQDLVNSIYGKWSSGLKSLNVETEKVTIDDKSYNMQGLTIFETMDGLLPGFLFASNLATYAIIPEGEYLQILKSDATGNFLFFGSFIAADIAAQMEGVFVDYTELGLETIIFKDGEFQIDAKGEEPGTLERLTLDYNLYVNEGTPILEFGYNEVGIDIEFDSDFTHASLTVVEYKQSYLRKEFYDVQGLYGSSEDAYLSVVDSTVIYNGVEMTVDSINGKIISGFVGTDYVSATFSEGSVSVVVGEAEPVVLAKNEVQLVDFILDLQENVAELGLNIKVTEYGIFTAFTGSDKFDKVLDFTYEFDDLGNVTVVFHDASGAYTYTLSIVEGKVVLEGESSLPPLPPPPPPLPF